MRAAIRPPTVAVVARSGLFRAGLASLLERSEFARIVEAAALQALPLLLRASALPAPSLLLMETAASTAGFVCGDARRLFPASRIVAICDDFDLEAMQHCLAVGVDGYLLKDIDPGALAESLRLVKNGEKFFPSRFAAAVSGPPRTPAAARPDFEAPAACRLSEREQEVLRCVATGDSNKLIARRLGIAEATVKVHLKAVLRKLGATNRTQAAIFALGGHHPGWPPPKRPWPLRVTAIRPLDEQPAVAAHGATRAAAASDAARSRALEGVS